MSLTVSSSYAPAAVGNPLPSRGSAGLAFEDMAASAAAAAAAAVVNGNMRASGFSMPASVGLHHHGLVAERRERVLLRPWLENLIDGGTVPGLEWIDDVKTMFKVPWKHRSKKNWSLLHSCVFLEWAKNTGRWVEGDPEPNYAQLKTRLRCAFNKAPDIEEMKTLHVMKCDEPYKVYRFTARRDGKTRPFARTFVTRASIPLASRRRRRRLNMPPSSSSNAATTSSSRPVTVKYEPVSSDCGIAGESQRLTNLQNENGNYYRSCEIAWKSEARLAEQTLSRTYAAEMKHHCMASLAVDTKTCGSDEDLKPIVSSTSLQQQPRRRILPEADAEFEFYQPPCSWPHFRSPPSAAAPIAAQPKTAAAQPTLLNERDAMASRLLVLQAASLVVEEESHRETTRKNHMNDADYYNNLRNREYDHHSIEHSSSTFIPRCATDVHSAARIDVYEEQSLVKLSFAANMSSSQSDQSSLSPVSSEPSEPSDCLTAPTKLPPPPARISEDISAPRLHRLKKRYLQSQLLEEEQRQQQQQLLELKEQVEQNKDKAVFRYDEQTSSAPCDYDRSSCQVPVARALPVIAITDSIASLNFGKHHMSPDGDDIRDSVVVTEDRRLYGGGGYYSTEMDMAPSPPMSPAAPECPPPSHSRMLDDGRDWRPPSVGDDWQCNGIDKYGRDSTMTGVRYATTTYVSPGDVVGRAPPAVNYYDEIRSPVDCKDHVREEEAYWERKMRLNAPSEAMHTYDTSTKSMMIGYSVAEVERRDSVVDLTGGRAVAVDQIDGCDCADAIDLSVKAVDENRRKISDEHRTTLSKHQYDREMKHANSYASPGVQSDFEQMEATLRQRTELIASKSAALVSRERQLEALEQQLAAREALLYHERRQRLSPEFDRQSSSSSSAACNMRMLPVTEETVTSRGLYATTVPRVPHGCNEMTPPDARYCGMGGDPIDGGPMMHDNDILKPKRPRMVETSCGNIPEGAIHRLNYQPPQPHPMHGMFETNDHPTHAAYVHRRASTAGSDTISSSSALTPPSAEPNWNGQQHQQQHPLSKYSGMSPPEIDGLLMSRKRGRPKGSKNRAKFETAVGGSGGSLLPSPTSNAVTVRRVSSVNGLYDRRIYDDMPAVRDDLRVSPEFVRVQSCYDERLAVQQESTIKRSPVFSGGQVFTSENGKVQAPAVPLYVEGGASAAMPATVRQLVKSAAGTTGGSILPPLSPVMDGGDASLARHAHKVVAGAVGYACNSGRYVDEAYSVGGFGTAGACSQFNIRFGNHAAGGPPCVPVNEGLARPDKIRDLVNYKQPLCHQGQAAGAKGDPSTTVGNAESRRMLDRGPYVNGDDGGRMLPNAVPTFDCGVSRHWEHFNRTVMRGRSQDSASNDLVGCGRLVINLEAD